MPRFASIFFAGVLGVVSGLYVFKPILAEIHEMDRKKLEAETKP